jgi:hypothetical protein
VSPIPDNTRRIQAIIGAKLGTQTEPPTRSFFDRRNLALGLPWVRALEQAIGAAKAVSIGHIRAERQPAFRFN